jgi:hypothetical protein
MGKKPEAIDMLRRAKVAGYQNLEWTRRDPDLACLHGEPEFEKLFDDLPAKPDRQVGIPRVVAPGTDGGTATGPGAPAQNPAPLPA